MNTTRKRYRDLAKQILKVEKLAIAPLGLPTWDGPNLRSNPGDLSDLEEQRLAARVCLLVPGVTDSRWAAIDEERRIPWLEEALVSLGRDPNNAPPANKELVRHSPDFRSVHWYGADYTFTATQAKCVEVLWKAWENGSQALGQAHILEEAGSMGSRLRDVFAKGAHPAWEKMIVPCSNKGAFALASPI